MNPEKEFEQLCQEIQYCEEMLAGRDFVDMMMTIIAELLTLEEYKDSDLVDRFACDLAISVMETLISELSCKNHNN